MVAKYRSLDSQRYTASRVPRSSAKLFPVAADSVVVDDVHVDRLDGWTHYFPWDCVDPVERGELELFLIRIE